MSLETLNHDCIFHIFRYLTIPDVINAEMCCPHLAEAAFAYYHQIHELTFMLRTLNARDVEPILHRVSPALRTFKFSGGYIMNNELKDKIVQSLAAHCTRLQALTLNYVTLDALDVLEPAMRNLVHLDLSHIHLEDAVLGRVLGQSSLRSLSLRGNTKLDGSCLKELRHVEKLDVSYCFELQARELYDFLRNCDALKHLNVSGCGGLSKTNFWQEVVESQPNIEELIMRDLNAAMPEECVEKFRNLKNFDASGKHFFESFRFQ